ncbi:hypothetical protein ES703_79951 [subsurface metagenome]
MTSKRGVWDKIVLDELGKRITGEIKSREIIFLCALGKLVKNADYSSFNLLIHSESSAGKDYIAKQVLRLFPDADVCERTRITPRALNYWRPYIKAGKTSWDGIILYLPDLSDEVMNCEALKLMCSEGSFVTIVNKGKSKDIEIKGKPVIITTTASATPTEEIMNRFSIVKLDESEEQTKAIKKMQGNIAREGIMPSYDGTIQRILQELKPHKVKIPFAHKISKVFPSRLIRERRNFNRLLDWIKAVTIFYQDDKTKHRDGFIDADLDDYDIAKDIFMNLYSGVSEVPLNRRQKDIVKVMENQNDPLSASDILSSLGEYIELRNFRPHLDKLVNIHVLDRFELRNDFNQPIIKYRISEEFKEKEPIKLPNSEELR